MKSFVVFFLATTMQMFISVRYDSVDMCFMFHSKFKRSNRRKQSL